MRTAGYFQDDEDAMTMAVWVGQHRHCCSNRAPRSWDRDRVGKTEKNILVPIWCSYVHTRSSAFWVVFQPQNVPIGLTDPMVSNGKYSADS